ncbi:MAG: 2-oxoglutarate and iron-dependent oxygenase domain-containing protein [Pantoea sp.]|uniref:isopenicillin N synthase family dioxygenase n=1 Tax=Pantoea sp. TaxID=69393 RepID=UPI002395864C|nr:2OG-Fe(II) oxygenase family protein [Pantoea sp.]MDE1186779.1 2-oxoglutarate and iron-dependent oxygenase domain-containing protein [Pantoea sp.]
MEKTTTYTMHELAKESRMGARGSEAVREVRIIDLADFDQRKHEIADQLWQAAIDIGFFQVSGHDIPLDDINAAFANAERFFALPESEKARHPLSRNAGWEYRAQIRPSTGKPDQKESYQITLPRMAGLWPDDDTLPGFRDEIMKFERQCWAVGMKLLSCFALKLGFPEDFFSHAHEPSHATYQSTLRMLHYFAITGEVDGPWRAGAHTDFDCLTLLFQRDGQGGLQVCPGKEMEEQVWTPIAPLDGLITCNIGDMLMRWSDDKLPSNFHRVANPLPGESVPARYSLAFFCQANEDVIIEGPEKKYPPISAKDYLAQRISANFSGKY